VDMITFFLPESMHKLVRNIYC